MALHPATRVDNYPPAPGVKSITNTNIGNVVYSEASQLASHLGGGSRGWAELAANAFLPAHPTRAQVQQVQQAVNRAYGRAHQV